MRGLTLYRLNRRTAAIPFLERALTAVDERVRRGCELFLGRCYIGAKKYDDARAAFAAQYGFGAGTGAAYLLMAQMFLREELPELAEENAKRALQLSLQLAPTHFMLGKIELARGDTTHALMKALSLDQTSTGPFILMVKLFLNDDDPS
ncbi:MAG TPA: hypothetical protein VGM27_13470 [Acidobacteriaceae bacterium]|jgi:tetratricopeptide (TPR) repeat protein